MTKIIDNFRGEYSFLSNFYGTSVIYNNHTYKSSEHAFAACKATNEKDRAYISDANTPTEAKHRGREITCRPDWDEVKITEMGMILYCKFSQNKWLQDKLCATDDAILIEGNWWKDYFWGMVKDAQGAWCGENYLGRLLMAVRNVFVNTNKLKG